VVTTVKQDAQFERHSLILVVYEVQVLTIPDADLRRFTQKTISNYQMPYV
ncbi:hypothetical protein C5S39_14955, partial [Candidatus Methanophagaceae archaeon]